MESFAIYKITEFKKKAPALAHKTTGFEKAPALA